MKALFIALLVVQLLFAKSLSIKQSLLDAAKELQEAQAEDERQTYSSYKNNEQNEKREELNKNVIVNDDTHRRSSISAHRSLRQGISFGKYAVGVQRPLKRSPQAHVEGEMLPDYSPWKPKMKPSDMIGQPELKDLFSAVEDEESNHQGSMRRSDPYFRNELFGKNQGIADALIERAFQNTLVKPKHAEDSLLDDKMNDDKDEVYNDPYQGIFLELPENEIRNERQMLNDENVDFYRRK